MCFGLTAVSFRCVDKLIAYVLFLFLWGAFAPSFPSACLRFAAHYFHGCYSSII